MPNALHAPPIDVLNNIKSIGFPMLKNQIFLNPRYKVIFEDAFDKLVEYIRCDQFMNISVWKAMGKWLRRRLLQDYVNRI